MKHLSDCYVLLTTAPSVAAAESIAKQVLDKQLAACVNLVPQVRSFYRWQGKIACDEEVQLVIKTTAALLDELEQLIRSVHPYEVPELIALPIAAMSDDYQNWLLKSVKSC
ncbi:MAG: divalent-cation tolerance protein CutA [Gammaproteobacteria bacterium]|nr:divalent-cation tolerance protein CutA [Gammaproteobacteria bacterium]NVK88444.1 divalent-cation tolerance protein CutA [Gammaproteobacteria bacterium]